MTRTGPAEAMLWICVLLIAAVGCMMLLPKLATLNISVNQTKSHAVLQHGVEEAQSVRDCVADPELKQYRLIVKSSKYVDVCDSFSFFGFQVMLKYGGDADKSKWSELTAYLKDGVRSLSDLKAFAQKSGFDLFERTGTGPGATLKYIP